MAWCAAGKRALKLASRDLDSHKWIGEKENAQAPGRRHWAVSGQRVNSNPVEAADYFFFLAAALAAGGAAAGLAADFTAGALAAGFFEVAIGSIYRCFVGF